MAASKFGTGSPIDDPAREQQVLGQVRDQATALGLDPEVAAVFFRDQITASKVVQRGLFDRWTAHPREEDHARLVAQIYADAAVSPALAALVQRQLEDLRQAVAALLPHHAPAAAERAAEAFVTLCHGYTQQLAVRGDLDPAPYTAALKAIIEP